MNYLLISSKIRLVEKEEEEKAAVVVNRFYQHIFSMKMMNPFETGRFTFFNITVSSRN